LLTSNPLLALKSTLFGVLTLIVCFARSLVIDSVRGVNSDSVLRTLTRHGLIEEVGRSEGPGRPFLYSTTTDFLSYFGLRSMQDLPPLQLEPDFELPHEPSVEDQQDSRSLDE
jgi:hypothetical protein